MGFGRVAIQPSGVMCYNRGMSKENQQTLEVYERYYNEFFAGTVRRAKSRGAAKTTERQKEDCDFWDDGFRILGKHAKILEVGSADGTGAQALAGRGYDVQPSDAVEGFLAKIRENGLVPLKFNVLTDQLEGRFQGILAWHVLIHLTKADFSKALKNLYRTLYPGGRLVFDLQNSEDRDGTKSGWVDYDGDYHLGAKRYFCYHTGAEARDALEKAGFKVVKLDYYGGDSGVRWLRIVAEKPVPVSPELVKYVETEIFPRYEAMKGHGVGHIKDVIRRSLDFAERINTGEIKTSKKDFANLPSELVPGAVKLKRDTDGAAEAGGPETAGNVSTDKVNYDMVYAIAAYHDLGRDLNDKLHHLTSVSHLLSDRKMWEMFDRDQLRVMADAIMDHRASNELDPLTIYGKIVSSADRDTDVKVMFRRANAYFRHLMPEASDDEVVENACAKLYKKFVGEAAYAAKKMYFKNPAYEAALAEYNRLAADQKTFHEEVKKALKEAEEEEV